MIEFEKKLLLEKDEYSCLLRHFGKDKPIVKQINYYFDSDDLSMHHQNTTCRIRLKNGKYTATIKRHISNSDGSTETEAEVRNGIYENAFIDMGLKLQGELVTERLVLCKDETCEVVLDKNDYLGHTDYELEIEYLPEYEQASYMMLKAICDVLMSYAETLTSNEFLKRIQNISSKSKRFFERRTTNDLYY